MTPYDEGITPVLAGVHRVFLKSILMGLAAFLAWGLTGCSSMNTASTNPLESKLLALEGQSLQQHKANLAAQREDEQARLASLASLEVDLPKPDLHEASDVIGPTLTSNQADRNGSPIGRVSN